MSKYICFFILSLFLLYSCKKEEPPYKAAGTDTYWAFIDSLELDCPEDTSAYYFIGLINGYPTCYYDGVDGKVLYFSISSIFTTGSPTFNSGDPPSNIRKGANLSFHSKPYETGDDNLRIDFPDFNIKRDTIDYLDSLFSIEWHEVASKKEELKNKFIISIYMIDVIGTTGDGGLGYYISTRYGPQPNSWLRFKEVRKTLEPDGIYYSVIIEFECDLYYNPQYGVEDLFGRIEDGVIVAKFWAARD